MAERPMCRCILVGTDWPAAEEVTKNLLVRMDKSKPMSTYVKQICTKLGVDSMDGLTVYPSKVASLVPVGDPLDMGDPVPCPPTSQACAVYIQKGDAPLPSAPAKKPAKKGSKPGAKPASPKAASKASPKKSAPAAPGEKKAPAKPGGKASPKASPKSSPKKSSPKSSKPAAKKSPSPPPNPTGAKEKKKKPSDKKAADSGPPPIPVAPPPAYPGESLGLPQSPLVAPTAYRHSYQPFESNPLREENRKKLLEFYMKHSPSHISKIDSILEAYQGDEDKMWLKLKETYEGPLAASRLSVASAVPLPQQQTFSTPQPTVTLAAIGKEQELKMKLEDEKMHSEMKNRVDSTLRELQEMRRREALEREERESRDKRERDERDIAMKRDMERASNDRRSIENLIRERQHTQSMREDEIERRDRELRKRQDDLAHERQEMKRRELDHQQFVANEEREMRARAERILSQTTIGSAAPSVNGGQLLSKTPQILSQLEDENTELRTELQKIQRSMEQQSIPLPRSAAKSPPPAELQTPGSPESPKRSQISPKKEKKYSAEFEPVAEQLERAGLHKYVPVLASHDFDTSAFRLVTDSDLKELGISAVGARKRIVAEAEKLRLAASVASPRNLPTFDEQYSLMNRGSGIDTPGYAESQMVNSKVDRVETMVSNLRNKVDVLVNKSIQPQSPPPIPVMTRQPITNSRQKSPVAKPSSSPQIFHSNTSLLTSSQTLQWHQSVLKEFYQTNDVIKVPQVDQILTEYHTNLNVLYETLVNIYNIEASQYADDVRKTCLIYFPGREPAAEIVCRICKGREAELVEQLILEGRGEMTGSMTEHYASISRWAELEHPEERRIYYYNDLAKLSQWAKPAALRTKDKITEEVISTAVPSTLNKIPFSSVGASSPPNPTVTEWQTRVTHYRAWLCAFLVKHDPKRLEEVDSIIARYKGHEDNIPSAFQVMYGTQ